MSHFVVVVTNTNEDSLEAQLEPFYEQGEEYDYFMEKEYYLKRDKDEITAWLKNDIKGLESLLASAEEHLNNTTDEKEKEGRQNAIDWHKKSIKRAQKILKIKDIDKQIQAIQEYNGGGMDKEGLYWLFNPNAKWDWWQEGGRWNGFLVDKNGKRGNRCLVKDIDFDNMRKAEMEDAGKYWDEEMARAKEADRKPFFWDFKEIPTREEYMESRNELVAPFAFLHEGEWVEKGDMGWWGISEDKYSDEEWAKKFQEFVQSLDPETELTIVDCHI